ncbi:YhcN/YlaJ family sporulation lipoprotein [Neobacillus jeddahensis]|uniref:YhcN/YlaJ family sporulation lipoprotein n=1 Tax=Neobacillus jeddahensis TaxID=1461580 RepID=UPI0006937C4B|nr:YhcN/YlaJ family sporulation lipoprotein [Neobacillus jeddahensis]
MKKRLVPFVLVTTLIGLTGCANDNNDNAIDTNQSNMGENVRYNSNNGVDVRDVRNNTNNGLDVRNVRNDVNQNLRVSTRAGQKVENLKQVDLAHVIIRNNDAYVAVKLTNNNQTGTTTNNGTTMGTTGISRKGTTTRTSNLNAPGVGNGQNGNYPSTTGSTGTNNTDTAINPGTRANSTGTITGTTGVRDTGLNGIAPTDDANFKKATSGLDKEIAKQVRAAEKNIDHVYVSYDTTFFQQMTNYTNDISNGRNRDNLWNDFTNTTRDIFR